MADGRLADNIVHFTHALRKAGVRVGTAQLETAVTAAATAGIRNRADMHAALRATLITRADDIAVFDQLFAMFWRDPEILESLIQMMSPKLRDDTPPPPAPAAHRRAADAMDPQPERPDTPPKEQAVADMTLSWSDTVRLGPMDFDQMSAADLAEAARAIARLRLPVRPLPVRRDRPATSGRADPKATLRAAMHRGGEIGRLSRKASRARPPDLVAICDISGSMSVYARMVMRLLHALAHARTRHWGRVQAFTIGTDLTNVGRALDRPDPDAALAAIGTTARDWDGGTRIGDGLARFNRVWARRVLSQGAVVLLITDGLERGDIAALEAEMARLSRTARQVIWLNPLLRFDGFAPAAGGVRAMLRHVDSLHACHSLDSLTDLAAALGDPSLRDRLRTLA